MWIGYPRTGFRRRLWRGAIILGIVLFLWVTISSIAAYRLTHRFRAHHGEPMPRVGWGPFESHRITTRDREEIGTWYVDGRDDAPGVLVIHGNKGSRQNSLTRAKIFAYHGCAVLLVTLRAHGDSSGDFHDVGFSARHDVLAAVDFLEHKRPGRPLLIMGTSMGAAAAIFAGGELDHRVQGYILESPYQDLKTAVWNRTNLYLPPVLGQAAYLGLRAVGPLFLPNLDEISPLKAIGGIPDDIPVLILAGDSDQLARPEEARALHRQVAAHGRLILFPGADHHNLPDSAPELFKRTLLEFCARDRGCGPGCQDSPGHEAK